ncbi:PQQ-binding-like beta-propeller repeat protein [Sphingobium aquiterrae]|uniref:outer membrane protein assembly factor BamB family protein n=1 Tax=Sphingobium aquiterrae TaxID=2038656 RepID=UPI0030163BBC
MMRRALPLLLMLCGSIAHARPDDDWPSYAGDAAATRHTTLGDIDAASLPRLRQAWSWRHFDAPDPAGKTAPAAFETTPLMLDGLLYVSTPYGNVAALDPVTGKEKWRFDTHGEAPGPWRSASGFKNRGVAAWRDRGRLFIFVASRTGLYRLDARTGRPVDRFGDHGRVAINTGPGYRPGIADPANLQPSSPPLVVGDVVILGGALPDRLLSDPPPEGAVQAFDARTGKRRWVFHIVPRSADAPGAASWRDGSWARTGHGNVWAPMSADLKRGLVYLPTSTTTNDFYGGARKGDGLFAEALVCLDARTGKVRWHFQTVHHGVWDYDNPAAPNLMTITVGGHRIDAVAQVSKQGFTYVFDRVTGTPVWPIVERPVPTDTDIPGEALSPTQPFPTLPPPLIGQGVALEDANDLTPEIAAAARAAMSAYRIGPVFTPQTLRGTLQRPSVGGGANWGGAAFDPASDTLYVRVNDAISLSRVARVAGDDPTMRADYAATAGSRTVTLPGGIPLTRPPYAMLVAVDMDHGAIRWRAPLGEGRESIRNHPALKGVALPARLGNTNTLAGPLSTPGLVFIVAGDGYLYAFDKATGAERWRGALPYPTGASPMSYRGADGRQYLVVATGSGTASALIAFALEKGTHE